MCDLCDAVWGTKDAPTVTRRLMRDLEVKFSIPRRKGIELMASLPMIQWLDFGAIFDLLRLRSAGEVLRLHQWIWLAAIAAFWLGFFFSRV